MKLGFFDSGLGGLTIMRAVARHMPHYEYLYYGDTEHLPYGDKPEEEIYEYTKKGVKYLFDNGAILVVLACNTASAKTLRTLQDTFVKSTYPDRNVLGVIIPTIEEVLMSRLRRPLLIATKRTVDSRKYIIELSKISRSKNDLIPKLTSVAIPELVPLIEAGNVSGAFRAVQPVIDAHIQSGGDSVILGCTHYTALTTLIRDTFGKKITVLSQDEIIPQKLMTYLDRHVEYKEKLSVHNGAGIVETVFRTKEMDTKTKVHMRG